MNDIYTEIKYKKNDVKHIINLDLNKKFIFNIKYIIKKEIKTTLFKI